MFIIKNNINEVYEFSLCAMNCPKHTIIYKNMNPNISDLPIRLADFGPLHRNEISGSLRGLTRVRLFHQDDAHIFCTKDQIKKEIITILEMMNIVYEKFNFKYELTLSTRPDEYIGDEKLWTEAEKILIECINTITPKFIINEKDGAFYGPKIDIQIVDIGGRKHQLSTIQLDFNIPINFNLKYKFYDEKKEIISTETSIMIHRAIFGSIERFMAILLEQTQGILPFWLSSRQIIILPVQDKHLKFSENIKSQIEKKYSKRNMNIIIDISEIKGSVTKRIKKYFKEHYNIIVVVGDKEVEENIVSVNDKKQITKHKIPEFIDVIEKLYNL
jgi:Threonyl-tRNA synthetase